MKTLVIEGWRASTHSFALANQHQLLHLVKDQRFRVFHRDVAFFRDHWKDVDSGLPAEAKSRIESIPAPPSGVRADVTYRISYPLRLHSGEGKVYVFGTTETQHLDPSGAVGADGHGESAQFDAVDIVTSSTWSAQGFLRAGFSPDRVHVIPLGVDPALAVPVPENLRLSMRLHLRIESDQFAFVNVSAMTENKGIGPLLAAFSVHRRSHPKSLLVLKGGDALYGNWLKPAIEQAGRLRPEALDPALMDSVRYIDQNLSQQQMAALYQASGAYIAPYRAEGFNLPVLEAMASGLPVLVTLGGATEEFCPDDMGLKILADRQSAGQHRWLEPRVDSIIAQMDRIVEDSQVREQLSRRARTWAVERFSWTRVTAHLADLLARNPSGVAAE